MLRLFILSGEALVSKLDMIPSCVANHKASGSVRDEKSDDIPWVSYCSSKKPSPVEVLLEMVHFKYGVLRLDRPRP